MPLVPHALTPRFGPTRRAATSLLITLLSLSALRGAYAAPARAATLVAAGDAAARHEDYAAALADFNQAVALAPNDADALVGRAVVEVNLGRRDRVMADSQKALSLAPRNARAFYARAGAYLMKADYGRAEADLNQALAYSPKTPKYRWKVARIYYAMGLIDAHRGKTVEAERHFTQSIALDNAFVAAHSYRSYLRLREGDTAGAIADPSAVLALHPPRTVAAYAFYERGAAYAHQKDYQSAAVELSSAIAADPTKALYYSSRGAARGLQGDYRNALPDLTAAIRLAPKDPMALYNRGGVYFYLHQLDRAIADYTKAISLDGKMESAYASRGTAYEHQGDYSRAIADETTAIAMNPKDVMAYRYRAFAYARRGDHARAASDAAKANSLNRPPT